MLRLLRETNPFVPEHHLKLDQRGTSYAYVMQDTRKHKRQKLITKPIRNHFGEYLISVL